MARNFRGRSPLPSPRRGEAPPRGARTGRAPLPPKIYVSARTIVVPVPLWCLLGWVFLGIGKKL